VKSGGRAVERRPLSSPLQDVRALYICYFGLREPLVQTQVLPYLRELAAEGAKIFLLTFEPERWDHAPWRERLRADGIEWLASKYHKRPTVPATLFDIAAGVIRTVRVARKHRIAILHARGQVPALIGAIAKRFTRAKLLFDVRGLMADEYVEAGNWKAGGWLYRTAKGVDRFLYRSADAFVVLTERLRREQFAAESKPVEVIPCCLDPERFAIGAGERDRIRSLLGASDRTVIVYAGSLGGSYLEREMAEFFAAAKRHDPRVFPLILTHSNPDRMMNRLASLGFSGNDFHIELVAPQFVPKYLAAGDLAVSIVKPGYSKIAMSPTKFAEYLASGLPVIATRGIGDVDEQIERERAGVLLDGLDAASYEKAFTQVQALRNEPELPGRCRAFAASAYDLHSVGGARYSRLYRRLQP